MSVQEGRYGYPKIKFSSYVAKFAGKIGIELMLFFVRFLVSEIQSILVIIVCNFTSVFLKCFRSCFFFLFINDAYLRRCTMLCSELIYS